MRFVTFVKRCDTPTLIRCLMEAFEYFGGLTKVALTDRMKSVLLEMEEKKPRWNPRFADFMVSIGVAARVCKPYRYRWRIDPSWRSSRHRGKRCKARTASLGSWHLVEPGHKADQTHLDLPPVLWKRKILVYTISQTTVEQNKLPFAVSENGRFCNSPKGLCALRYKPVD
jgi:hypothetical protein